MGRTLGAKGKKNKLKVKTTMSSSSSDNGSEQSISPTDEIMGNVKQAKQKASTPKKKGRKSKKGSEVILGPGDMLIYKGDKQDHWREHFDGEVCAQVFLHYNDSSKPKAKDNLYDSREYLGLPSYFLLQYNSLKNLQPFSSKTKPSSSASILLCWS